MLALCQLKVGTGVDPYKFGCSKGVWAGSGSEFTLQRSGEVIVVTSGAFGDTTCMYLFLCTRGRGCHEL